MPLNSFRIRNFRGFPNEVTRFPKLEGEVLSPSLNLFIGPNGTGKTTLFNALRIVVCREALTSNVEMTSGSKRTGTEDRTGDFYDQSFPWDIEADFDLKDLGRQTRASVSQVTPDSEVLRTLDGESVVREPLTNEQAELRNRLFHSGWPRQLPTIGVGYDKKPVRAFEQVANVPETQLNNHEVFAKVWPRIRTLTKEYFQFDPGPEAPRLRPSRGVYGSELLDPNGRPLIEGSDGLAHVLFLVMEIEKHSWPTTFLVEEPDVFLHPGLQRALADYFVARSSESQRDVLPRHQFLVATHSPYILNAVVDRMRNESTGESKPRLFQMKWSDKAIHGEEITSDDLQWGALEAIGHRPSDVLLPNGLIWVEGPSDAVYLKIWLSKYAEEQASGPIVWGRDVEIVWYGGSLWCHLGAAGGVWTGMEDNDREVLLNLLKVNRNLLVVIDADDGLEGESGPPAQKRRLQADLGACRVWIARPRCIEGYIPDHGNIEPLTRAFLRARKALRAPVERKGHSKMLAARAYEKATLQCGWRSITDPGTDIAQRLADAYDRIIHWRGGHPP